MVFGLGIELVVGPGAELAVVGPGIEVVVGPGIELAAGLWVGLVVGPESEDLVVVGAGIELAAGLWVGLVVGPENEVVVCPVTESVAGGPACAPGPSSYSTARAYHSLPLKALLGLVQPPCWWGGLVGTVAAGRLD